MAADLLKLRLLFLTVEFDSDLGENDDDGNLNKGTKRDSSHTESDQRRASEKMKRRRGTTLKYGTQLSNISSPGKLPDTQTVELQGVSTSQKLQRKFCKKRQKISGCSHGDSV